MKLLNTILLLSAISFLSCNKSSDNSTTTDTADAYVGNYILTDTITYVDPNNSQMVTNYNTSSSAIAKVNANSIALNQFPHYGCGADTATVTATSAVLSGKCNAIANFICTKVGNILYYSYEFPTFTTNHVKGKAVKQ